MVEFKTLAWKFILSIRKNNIVWKYDWFVLWVQEKAYHVDKVMILWNYLENWFSGFHNFSKQIIVFHSL
jgi:hypothetical protein